MADDPYAQYLKSPTAQQPEVASDSNAPDPYAQYLPKTETAATGKDLEFPQEQPISPDEAGAMMRGAGQAFALGYEPQIAGAFKSGTFFDSKNPTYASTVDAEKEANKEAFGQHPIAYGTGMVLSAVPAAIGQVAAGPEEAVAAGALAGTANVGSLAGKIARGVGSVMGGAGETGARAVAQIAENPLVQGAIYGSSEGDTTGERLENAALGAAGAKFIPAFVNTVGSIGNALVGTPIKAALSHLVTGDPSTADVVANAANNLQKLSGESVNTPAGAVTTNPIMQISNKLDPLSQTANAAKQHLDTVGDIIGKYAGDYPLTPEMTGEAIQRSFVNDYLKGDGPNSLNGLLENAYAPAKYLEESPQKFVPSRLMTYIDEMRQTDDYKMNEKAYENTFATLNSAFKNFAPEQVGDAYAPQMTISQLQSFKDYVAQKAQSNTTLAAGVAYSKLQDAVNNDLSNLAKTISPAKGLNESAQKLESSPVTAIPRNIEYAIDSFKNSDQYKFAQPDFDAIHSDISNILDAHSPQVTSLPEMTIAQLRTLNRHISDQQSFNKIVPTDTLDSVLKGMGSALRNDRWSAASQIDPVNGMNIYKMADQNASNIFSMRDDLVNKLGNTLPGTPGAKTASSVFNDMQSMASKSHANTPILAAIKDAISPDAWDTFQRGYVGNNFPSKGFSYKDFQNKYERVDPRAMNLMFGRSGYPGTNNLRDVLDNVYDIARNAGPAYDSLAKQAGHVTTAQLAEGILAAAEPASAGKLGFGSGIIGHMGAKNITAPLPEDNAVGRIIGNAVNTPVGKVVANGISNAANATYQTGVEAVRKATPALSSQAATATAPIAGNWALDEFGRRIAPDQSQYTTEGRAARAKGGKVNKDPHDKARGLIARVEKTRTALSKGTSPLLDLDDNTVAKALAIANRNI